ncbi:MAG: hypothetical protein GYB68_13700 [Chloroflexi bacterium]|nr:hypothetical protein [Chloroflexota bacterium]
MTDATLDRASSIRESWQIELQPYACAFCESVFLLPPEASRLTCPTCFRDELDPISDAEQYPSYVMPPEKVLPFAISPERAVSLAEDNLKRIPLRPTDITPANLKDRLRPILLPMWLIDAEVQAQWLAEAGYYYEVVSHNERYGGSGWQTEQVKRVRTRWEPRAGELRRSYHNVTAAALEQFEVLTGRVGNFAIESGQQDYQPSQIQDVFVRVPSRPPEAAWDGAHTGFIRAAADEVRRAASADEIQQFKWRPDFATQNWTQLLIPLYSTYYLDDQGEKQVVYINGLTGQVWAMRQASPRRAQTFLFIGLALASLLVLGSVLGLLIALALPILGLLALLGVLLAVGVAIGGVVPVIQANSFNRRNRFDPKRLV